MLKYFEFENVRRVRMGLVKGGNELRYHEPMLTFQLKLKPISIQFPFSEIISLLTHNHARAM